MCFRSDRLSDGWLMLCNLSKCHGTVLQLLKPASSSLSLSRIKFSSNSWNCAKTFALGFFQTKLTIPNKREGFFFQSELSSLVIWMWMMKSSKGPSIKDVSPNFRFLRYPSSPCLPESTNECLLFGHFLYPPPSPFEETSFMDGPQVL